MILLDSQGQTYYGYSLCKQIQYDVDDRCQGFGRASKKISSYNIINIA